MGQRQDLSFMLKRHDEAFKGGVGKVSMEPVHLKLKEEARSHEAHAFPMPKACEATTKKETTG